MTRIAWRKTGFSALNAQLAIIALLALGMALFYWGGAAPLALLGLAVFFASATLRPDLAVLFVPLTAPLYLIPANIRGLRADAFLLPVHEAALLASAGAAAANWLWRRLSRRESMPKRERIDVARAAMAYAPHLLFLVAGALGVLIAVARPQALREFRWTIAEPLVFYALIRYYRDQRPRTKDERRTTGQSGEIEATRSSGSVVDANTPWSSVVDPSPDFTGNLLLAFALGGAFAGLLGLLQYVGVDLAPLLGQKQCFAPDGGPCANIVVDGGVRRVLSVYGHPNNLGLYLGRVWPLAAALALADRTSGQGVQLNVPTNVSTTNQRPWLRWMFGLLSVVCLGGIVVSFSRGAWLGAVAAAAVLALGVTTEERPRSKERRKLWSLVFGRSSRWLLGLGLALAVLVGLALSIRGDVTGGSTPVRLLLWREALGYIRLHPLGIGLDQFGFYHDPASGLSLIDPALIGTSDQYAAHPHNLLLDVWLRLGPLGLVAFGWLLARFFGAALRRARSESGRARAIAVGALAAMAAALAHGLVDNFYFVPDLAMAFWLLIALITPL